MPASGGRSRLNVTLDYTDSAPETGQESRARLFCPVSGADLAYATRMDDERAHQRRDRVGQVVGALSPEARSAFVRVYELLLEFGLQDLAAHPERVPEMATRARERSRGGGGVEGDQVDA